MNLQSLYEELDQPICSPDASLMMVLNSFLVTKIVSSSGSSSYKFSQRSQDSPIDGVHLNGTRWDSSVICEERGEIQIIEDEHKKENFQLYPDYLEIIANKIRSYPDLNEWIKYVVDTWTLHRKFHRWAIASADKRTDKELTWDEHIEWKKNNIEIDKMLNRSSHPYDEKLLKRMLDLGEEKWKEENDKNNKEMAKIFKELEDEGAFKK
jgi:hypothetical protein